MICEYLNDLVHGSLFPPEGLARWRTLTLQSLGDGILDAALLARYETVARPEQLRWPEWRVAQLDKAETALAHLNARPTVLEQAPNIGTIAVGCALWYLDLRFQDCAWRERHSAVADWYGTFSSRPSMSATWALQDKP